MGERAAVRTAKAWVLVAATAAASGCATTRAGRTTEPPTREAAVSPAVETLVMLRDLAPGQPLVAFGRWSAHLTQDGSARLRDAVVEAARRRGLEQVRTACAPVAVAPALPVAAAQPEGATWGGNVVTGSGSPGATWSEPPRPTPLPGATWLEITSLVLDQARLAEAPGSTALTLEVTAVCTTAPAAGRDPPRAIEVRFTLLDPELLAALDAQPGEGDTGTLRSATARLLDRAAGRLASLLVPAAAPVATPGPGPRSLPVADPGPAVPLEVTYVARTWVVPPVPRPRGRGAVDGALKGADAGSNLAYAGLLCGPLAPVCAGALALAGGGVGLVLGAVGGAANAPPTPPSGPRRAGLPPEAARAALLETLRHQAEGLSLPATVEQAALRALEASPGAAPAGTLPRLARVEVRLTGEDGPDHPARLALVLTTAPPPGRGGPDLLVLETPDALPAQTWADDDGALLRLVLERAAEAAGKALVARAREVAPAVMGPAGDGALAGRR
jgi:hypothetical protein